MKIAHLADLHLGYRAYHRMAPGGVNQRERDVADAVARTVDAVVAAEPDLVLVAGDVFHTVRPSNSAIMDGFRLFARLRGGLPDAPVVMISGNHDSTRSADTGSILRLLGEIPDTHVVDDAARTIRLDAPGAAVLCLPHPALVAPEPPELVPDPDADTNILMLHGTVSGTTVDAELLRMVEYGGAHIDISELRVDDWDYVALGHYHNAVALADHVWYAGATERTATNIWIEADTPKGWVLYDTERGKGRFQETATREVVDLPRFSARRDPTSKASSRDNGGRDAEDWLTAEAIDERIRDAVGSIPGGVEGKIVRLVVTDIPRDLFRQLDHRQIRALKAEALHFKLDARAPELRQREPGPEPRRRTLEEELEAFLAEWQPTTPGIDRARLVSLGKRYLEATEDWRETAFELGLGMEDDSGGEAATEESSGEEAAGTGGEA